MKQLQAVYQSTSAGSDEPVLDADELKTLAKFLDTLMEAEYLIKRNEKVQANDNNFQTS